MAFDRIPIGLTLLSDPHVVAIVVIVTALGAGVGAWRILRRRTDAAMHQLSEAMRLVTMGNLRFHFTVDEKDSLREVKSSFNELLRHVQQLMETKRRLAQEIVLRNRFEERLRQDKNAALVEAKAKDRLLADLAHEIRTSLSSIMGYSETLISGQKEPQTRGRLRTILREADQLLGLVDDLRENEQIENGVVEINSAPFDVMHVLEAIRNDVGVEVHRKHVDFVITVDPDAPHYLIGDEKRLRQALANLVSSAVKITERGAVNVHVEQTDGDENQATLRFSIADTSMGMPKEELDSILAGDDRAIINRGAYLSDGRVATLLARKLIARMGGSLDGVSEPGRGTTFMVDLPFDISDEPIETSLDRTRETPKNDEAAEFRGTVLVVEDYEINQDVIRMQLERLGLNVDLAADGLEAVEAVRGIRYDVIFMDINMPNLDGIEATRRIRQEDNLCRNAPIIALTANADDGTMHRCTDAGMSGVLTKPTHKHDMETTLRKWLPAEFQRDADRSATVRFNADDARCSAGEILIGKRPEPEETMEVAPDAFLDRDEALRLFGGNEQLLTMAIEKLRRSGQGIRDDLRSGCEEGDAERVRAAAHKLKGGAACLTAKSMAAVAEEIETLAEQGRLDGLDSLLERLDDQFEQLDSYMEPVS